ncbi:zinc finger protein 518A [Pristis pectinata]|uniref:zinc finger protein 518A n=1 Tax=Pristis pectinata TaxID=685728 RepID=UPI00223D2F75|nr:zinc finger protein 518A [Pristis pectinata]XP_051883866.1 zinc finger protein 518A [Pristis pectinata]
MKQRLIDTNIKRNCRNKLNMPTGNLSQKDKGFVTQKFAQVSFVPSITVNKQLQQELKFKLENAKVVLTRLDVEKISSDLHKNQSKTSQHRCQTARKSFRKDTKAQVDHQVNSFKDASAQNSLGEPSKTSDGTAKAVLVKVLRFNCGKCKDGAEYNPKQLLKHYQEFHAADSPVYPCELCDFTANDFQTLSQHRLKHRTPLLKCEVCCDGKMYTLQELRKHLNWKHGVNGNFRCEKCRFSTKDQGTFIQHIHRHDVIQYKCGKCEHVSYTKGEFQRHLVVHTGSFPFCCQYCNYGATRKDYIVKHINAVHKGLAEGGNSKPQVEVCQKGKVKNSLGLKLVLKRYKSGVTRKVQWRRKKQIQNLVTGKDNAKKSDDATKKLSHPVPQSPPDLDLCLNEEIISSRDIDVKKDEIWGPKPVALTSPPIKRTEASDPNQISRKILPSETCTVILKNNKLSLPPNYSAQFMGFKIVNGKQHLIIKLLPTNKQKLSASNSQTQANNDNLLHLPKNAGNSNVGLSDTNASSADAHFIRLSNILTSQPRTFLVKDHSMESKLQASTSQTVSHVVPTIIGSKFTQVKTVEPLIAGINSAQTGNLLLPPSSVRLAEITINKGMPENQVMQKIPTLEKSSVSNNYSSQIFVSSANNQPDSKSLQCLSNEQISKGKELDCDTSLQFKRGTHLPFIHNYAKVDISASKQSGVSIVQGDDSKSAMISLPSEAVRESNPGQPHKIVAGIVSPTDVSTSGELCISTSSQSYGFQKSGVQGLNEFNSPILLQMLKPSEVVNGKSESRFVTSKDGPVVMSTVECTSSHSNSSFLFTSAELGPETLSLKHDEACDNSVVANSDSCNAALKDEIASEQTSSCPVNVKKSNRGNYEPCLLNLNNMPHTEMTDKCESELEAEALKRDGEKEFGNDCEILAVRNCTTVQTKCELGKSNRTWSSSTDWTTCSEGNGNFESTEEAVSISANSASSQRVLDFCGSNAEKTNCLSNVNVEMMDCHAKYNINDNVSVKDFLEEQASDSDGSESPIMPRITSVFSLQSGDGMSCLAPEENQLLLDALKATSTFGVEPPCSESQCPKSSSVSFLEEQISTYTAENKPDLHNYSLKNNSLPMQLNSVNDESNSSVINNKCIDGRNMLLSVSPLVSSNCMPPNVEKLNTLLKTHSDEIINQQLIKDAIRTSANGSNNPAVPPVTLLGPIHLAGITKPVIVQPSQKGSAVPLHLAKQSRLQMVSRDTVPQTKVVTRNSASLTDKGPGLILTFSSGTLGAVASIVCGSNPPVSVSGSNCVQGQTSVSDSVQQNTCSLTSDSRVVDMETAPINTLSSKDPLCKGPVSAVFDHHSYAKLAADPNNNHSTENGSANVNSHGENLISESSVSNNLVSAPLRQGTMLEGVNAVRDKNTEHVSSQQTVLFQCIMQKKNAGVISEENVANAGSVSEENGPHQKKILLRFVKSSNGESGMKDNQFLKNTVSLHNGAAGNLNKPLQQPGQAVMLTSGSPCILLPVNKPVSSSTANLNIPLQITTQASLKLPIAPVVRGSSVRSTEKRSTNKGTSVAPQRSTARSNCIWDNEKSDELWEPRKSCNEKLVYRYSKRLKRKLENSEKSSKAITSSFSEFEETEEEEISKSLEVSNTTASGGTVQTLRLVPFDHGQLVKCPRRNQPVIVLNHPDADVPEVMNVMKTIKKCKGNVLKVVLSKRTIGALLHPCNSNEATAKGFLINQCKKIKPVSPVKERYVLKLKLKKTSKNNYQIVKTVSNKAIEARFSCWFCGRIFDNQDEWVGHGQRHLMEATRDWDSLL